MLNEGLLQQPVSVDLPQLAVDALQHSPDAVVMLDATRRVVFFNAQAEVLWQQPASALLGQSSDGLIEPLFEGAGDPLVAGQREARLRRSDGSQLHVTVMLSSIDREGSTWTVVYIRDVTDTRREHELMLQRSLVVDETDNAIMVCDPARRVMQVNRGFTRLLGYSQDEMRGRRGIEVLAGPHTDVQALANAAGDPARPVSFRTEALIYTKAGQPLWLSVAVDLVFDAQARLTCVVAVLSDITLTKTHQVLQHKVLDALVRELPVAKVMELVCEEAERIAPGMRCTVLEVDEEGLMHPLAGPRLPAALGDALEGQPVTGAAPCSLGSSIVQGAPLATVDIASDPLWVPYRHHVLPLGIRASWSCPIRASDGSMVGAFSLYYKTQRGPTTFEEQLAGICVQLCALALERERVRIHMHQLSSFDTLTGLANRATVRTRAAVLLAGLPQSSLPLAVLCIALDRFKSVNEVQGHEAGDALLREVANRLLHCVRSIDLIGRLSGDEFVAILPACSDEQAAHAASRIQAAIAVPLVLEDVTFAPGASIGVAMFPHDGADIDALLHHADLAMVQAKADGRGGTRFFNDEMQRRTRERVELEAALRSSLRSGALKLHYQPQVDCTDNGRLHGVEALARWTHPHFGEVEPSRFIPLAEEAGLIDELGRWALVEACQQMARWRQAGVAVPHVAVNLSARNFHDEGLPAMVAHLLGEHGLAASDLTLEMTESAMLDASFGVVATIEALRAMGVKLSLDDFGTGYSSLSYLHRLPMDELKLDQSFVRDLSASTAARALTNTILRIGDSLSLTVVAEGVELPEQAAFLASRGCAVLQGFLYGRPMPAEALELWIAERALLDAA